MSDEQDIEYEVVSQAQRRRNRRTVKVVLKIDLVSQPQIAERLGVTTNTVHVWRQRHDDFPEPEWQLGQVPVWRWEVIEGWALSTGRLDKETP